MPQTTPRDAVSELIAAALEARGGGAQSDLARVLAVTPTTVRRWRLGETIPDPIYWPAIEDYFGWTGDTIDDLLTHDGAARMAKVRENARRTLVDPKATDAQRVAAMVTELQLQVDDLRDRVVLLEQTSPVAEPAQFASAADTGAGGKVDEVHGTSRRRVTPAEGE